MMVEVFSHFCWIITFMTLGLWLFGATQRPLVIKFGVMILIVIALYAPFQDLLLIQFFRGYCGDLSITMTLLAKIRLIDILFAKKCYHQRDWQGFMIFILLMTFFLYPLYLGATYWDPYVLGFGGWPIGISMTVLGLVAISSKFYLIGLCLMLAMLMQIANLSESKNIWNNLLDPFAAVYAIGWAVRRGVETLSKRYIQQQLSIHKSL